MGQTRGSAVFTLFIVWLVVLSDVGFVVMFFFDPLYGLGAIILTLFLLLAFVLGWLPLPGDSGSRRTSRTRDAK